MVKHRLLPRIVSFIKQLSLFDTEPTATMSVNSGLIQDKNFLSVPHSLSNPPEFSALCVNHYSHIHVSSKPRMRENWRVTWTHRNQELLLEIPKVLLDAPIEIKHALLDWALLASLRKHKNHPEKRQEKIRLEKLIRSFLQGVDETGDQNHSPAHLKKLKKNQQNRLARMQPLGRFHNLTESFNRVNQLYFAGNLNATVTWALRLGGRSTHSQVPNGLGGTEHLISISQGYDHETVTPEILDGVMYHECLHIAVPPTYSLGRRSVHGPEFKRRERQYLHFSIWQNWHRHGLPKSLRSLRRLKRLSA